MIVSVETPVFKGKHLERCIESVLYQSSPRWTFSLLWDGGDESSRRILEELERQNRPNVTIYFGENRKIARARRFLTEHSRGDFILPLDDDDALPHNAVEEFLRVAEQKPWASVIRARRHIIDQDGKVLDTPPWFPFELRHYQHGMVTDITNHAQPYLIRRSAYERTSGWAGFEEFSFAGEDCDLYLKLEEVGTIELLDKLLYYYRVHPNRQSLVLTDNAAFEMWRRLADMTVARIGLPLKRTTERPPFSFVRVGGQANTISMVDFVVTGGGAAPSLPGVSGDAIHSLEQPHASDLNAAYRRTSRPVMCILDGSVEVDTTRIEQLLRLMDESAADLVSPKLVSKDGGIAWAAPSFRDGHIVSVSGGTGDEREYSATTAAPWLNERFFLVRREVLNAVGGFDEGFGDARVTTVDFCLRARQRDFRCAFVGNVCFTCSASTPGAPDEHALARLRFKWADYPHLTS